MPGELQDIKEEIGQISIRLGNVEGYFDNFNTTLENHMTDYKAKQEEVDKKVREVAGRLSWGFWVIFSLLVLVLGGFVTGCVILLISYLGLKGG